MWKTGCIKLNNKVNHSLGFVCLWACVSSCCTCTFIWIFTEWKCFFSQQVASGWHHAVFVCVCISASVLPKSLMSDRTSQEIMAPPPSSMAPWPTSQLSKWPLSKTTSQMERHRVEDPKTHHETHTLHLKSAFTIFKRASSAQKTQYMKTKMTAKRAEGLLHFLE